MIYFALMSQLLAGHGIELALCYVMMQPRTVGETLTASADAITAA